jgi:hypothetical protein
MSDGWKTSTSALLTNGSEGCGTQEWPILVECCGWVAWGLDLAYLGSWVLRPCWLARADALHWGFGRLVWLV